MATRSVSLSASRSLSISLKHCVTATLDPRDRFSDWTKVFKEVYASLRLSDKRRQPFNQSPSKLSTAIWPCPPFFPPSYLFSVNAHYSS